MHSDGTRVEPKPEKPGFMYENLNPGSENQNPGFSGFEVLLFQSRFHSLISFSVTFEMDFRHENSAFKLPLKLRVLIYRAFQMVFSR